VLKAAHDAGFSVKACVSDMGPGNQSMWKEAGIRSKRKNLCNFVSHPFNSSNKLYFMGDTPHLLKNIRNCILNQSIILPQSFCSEHFLPSPNVSMSYISQLVDVQSGRSLKLAPNLTSAHVNPGQFQKMRVSLAAQTLSRSTASSIRVCVTCGMLPKEALATAYFCELVNDWFDLMNSRTTLCGLSLSSQCKLDTLHNFKFLFETLHFSVKDGWKPIQAGIQLSTSVVLSLFSDLVVTGEYSFLLPGKLTQDCVENIFSCIRGRGDSHPSPLKFRQNLKLLSISQFMRIEPNSNYTEDDSTYFLSFLRQNKTADPEVHNELVQFSADSGICVNLDFIDSNALFMLAGWVLFKDHVLVSACTLCKSQYYQDEPGNRGDECLLNFKNCGGLSYPSDKLVSAMILAETIFQKEQINFANKLNPEETLMTEFLQNFDASHFSYCHEFYKNMAKRFFQLRMHVHAKHLTSNTCMSNVQSASRSSFCRTLIS